MKICDNPDCGNPVYDDGECHDCGKDLCEDCIIECDCKEDFCEGCYENHIDDGCPAFEKTIEVLE